MKRKSSVEMAIRDRRHATTNISLLKLGGCGEGLGWDMRSQRVRLMSGGTPYLKSTKNRILPEKQRVWGQDVYWRGQEMLRMYTGQEGSMRK